MRPAGKYAFINNQEYIAPDPQTWHLLCLLKASLSSTCWVNFGTFVCSKPISYESQISKSEKSQVRVGKEHKNERCIESIQITSAKDQNA